jgi:hypothetical protein
VTASRSSGVGRSQVVRVLLADHLDRTEGGGELRTHHGLRGEVGDRDGAGVALGEGVSGEAVSFLGAATVLGGQLSDFRREIGRHQIGQGDGLEHSTQAATDGHPHLRQCLGGSVVVQVTQALVVHVGEGTVDGSEDVGERDLLRWTRQREPAVGAALRAHQFATLQVAEDVQQELQRHALARGDPQVVIRAGRNRSALLKTTAGVTGRRRADPERERIVHMAMTITPHDDTEFEATGRRRKITKFALAGVAVLGVGAALTSAAWSDNVWFGGNTAAADFELSGSLHGDPLGVWVANSSGRRPLRCQSRHSTRSLPMSRHLRRVRPQRRRHPHLPQPRRRHRRR